MIEDLQDEYKSISLHDDDEPNRAGMLLVAFVVWVIFTSVILLISRPKIQVALQQTDAIQVFKDRKSLREQTAYSTATLYFVDMKDFSKFGLIGFKTDVPQGTASAFHDALEGLLQGPSNQALSYGAITMIPKGTKLNGVTVSNRIAYVDLSSEFLVSSEQELYTNYRETARWQLLKTLQAVDATLREVVIIVNGAEI